MRWAPRTVAGTDTEAGRTRRRLAWTLGVLLATGGCQAPPVAEWPDVTPNPDPIAVAFNATVQVADQQIRISYQVTNNENVELIALNRVYRTHDGRWQTRPEFVYVVGKDGGRVEIGKRAHAQPNPSNINLVRSPDMAGTVLAPGGTLTEELTLSLPLQRSHPYGNNVGFGEVVLPDPITEIVFCLGVIPGSLATGYRSPVPATSADASGPALTQAGHLPHAGDVLDSQHLFCSEPAGLR